MLGRLASLVVLSAWFWGPQLAVAQTPAIPAAPAVPSTSVTTVNNVSAAGGASGGGGCIAKLFGFLHGCGTACCNTPFGQLMTGMVQPFSTLTGGIIPSPCPPGKGQAGAPGPAGAAAAIQQDEAHAKARRAAVRYLGTVDCHYYPEAECQLIAALRADRNECVRWEAAHALGNRCCCTKKTMEALSLTVSGSEKDGNPSESSPRVKYQAWWALAQCLANCEQTTVEEPVRPEQPVAPATSDTTIPSVQLAAYYTESDRKPMSQVVAEARRVLYETQALRPIPTAESERPQRNLLSLWSNSKIEPKQPASTGVGSPVPAGSIQPAPQPGPQPTLATRPQ